MENFIKFILIVIIKYEDTLLFFQSLYINQ